VTVVLVVSVTVTVVLVLSAASLTVLLVETAQSAASVTVTAQLHHVVSAASLTVLLEETVQSVDSLTVPLVGTDLSVDSQTETAQHVQTAATTVVQVVTSQTVLRHLVAVRKKKAPLVSLTTQRDLGSQATTRVTTCSFTSLQSKVTASSH
jgi:hypothetical protein